MPRVLEQADMLTGVEQVEEDTWYFLPGAENTGRSGYMRLVLVSVVFQIGVCCRI